MITAPAFWFDERALPGALLQPFACAYALGSVARARFTRAVRLPVPVICIGNVVLGGAGKTPVVADFAARLSRRGRKPFIISRGYGGREEGPLEVNPAQHSAADVGDEPLLLAATAPVLIAKNKVVGAQAALEKGADLLLLDDGLQNPTVHKTLSFLVIDAARGIGNGRVFPAGPLREPLEHALEKTDAVLWLGENPAQETLREKLARARPLFKGQIKTTCDTVKLHSARLLAFAGIGFPQKFFDGLRAGGADVVVAQGFPDHHSFTRGELEALLEKAQTQQLTPITTQKDAMRIPPDLRPAFTIAGTRLVWDDDAAVDGFLDRCGLFRHRETIS